MAGLTNDSDAGRASVAVRVEDVGELGERVAADGGDSHGLGGEQRRRGLRPHGRARRGPRDRRSARARRARGRTRRPSGEPAAPTVTRKAPRRAASAARARVPAARPDCETAMTTSRAPTQPGSDPDEQLWTGRAAAPRETASKRSATATGPPPAAATTTPRGSTSRSRSRPASPAAAIGAPHLRAGPGERAERVDWRLERRRRALVIQAGLVEHGAHRVSAVGASGEVDEQDGDAALDGVGELAGVAPQLGGVGHHPSRLLLCLALEKPTLHWRAPEDLRSHEQYVLCYE